MYPITRVCVGVAACLWCAYGAFAAEASPSQAAPDFVLPAINGQNVRLSEYRGEVVVLSFWSSRCALCNEHLAELARLKATYGTAGLVVLGISVDDDVTRAHAYARARQGEFPLLLDTGKQVSRRYGVQKLPSVVLIDRSGAVRYRQQDFERSDNPYIAVIKRLLDDEPVTLAFTAR